MRRFDLFLGEEQFKELQALSKVTGARIAELVRRAIDSFLKGERKRRK